MHSNIYMITDEKSEFDYPSIVSADEIVDFDSRIDYASELDDEEYKDARKDLLKCLDKIVGLDVDYDEGTFVLDTKKLVAYIDQHIDIRPNMTGWQIIDNLYHNNCILPDFSIYSDGWGFSWSLFEFFFSVTSSIANDGKPDTYVDQRIFKIVNIYDFHH